MKPGIEEVARKLTKQLSDAGKIIEGGWEGFRLMTVPENAPQVQIDEMRNAFFAGAQHLFSSIMVFLDAGEDITEKDIKRMSLIHQELENFIAAFKEKNFSHGRSGNA